MAARVLEQKLADLAQRVEDIAERLDAVAVERASQDILTVAAELVALRNVSMDGDDDPRRGLRVRRAEG